MRIMNLKTSTIPLVGCAAFFGIMIGITCAIFYEVYKIQATPYLDEIFHVPQAINYCNRQFLEWDPKITTLPGLYLLSIGVLGPIDYLMGATGSICNVFNLRLTNLITCAINFVLLYDIRRRLQRVENVFSLEAFLVAMNLGTFPILYFFTFLYYTDTVSTALVLLMYNLHLARSPHTAAFVGLIAVIVRQTNIVWVMFLVMNTIPDVIARQMKLKRGKYLTNSERQFRYFKILGKCLEKVWKGGIDHIVYFCKDCFASIGSYVLVGIMFAIFIIINQGIVVGDKSAHQPTLHVMQLLYFSAFVTVFSCPLFVPEIPHYLEYIRKNKKITLFALIVLLLLVHFNSIAHPYLLADNRHYVFYIWKRIYQKHFLYPYLMVPFYMFGGYGISRLLRNVKITFQISFLICVALCLVPQKLLEFRYFIIPYILLHLNMTGNAGWQMIIQFIFFLIVNLFTVYLFLTKTFYWSDSEEKQRIIW